jgi:hypothetical protein
MLRAAGQLQDATKSYLVTADSSNAGKSATKQVFPAWSRADG